MRRDVLLPAAFLLDRIAGDPEWLPHPVRLMGKAIARGETVLRRPGQSPAAELVSGAVLSVGLVASTYGITAFAIARAHRCSPLLGAMTEVVLGWTCLAGRNLEQEASSVVDALTADDRALARSRLARIVGRDTHALDESEISRAVIETVAESACDGFIAPLFYMALGGVPLAMAYKSVNTLDSMIGHADARYFYFGKFAARLDDAANLVPARLTAAGIVAASLLRHHPDADAQVCMDHLAARRIEAQEPERRPAGERDRRRPACPARRRQYLRGGADPGPAPRPGVPCRYPRQGERGHPPHLHGLIAGGRCCGSRFGDLRRGQAVAMSRLFPAHGGQLRRFSEQYGIATSELLDFSANINPEGPPPGVLSALRSSLDNSGLAVLTQYPDLEQTALKRSIALFAGVGEENVLISNGFVPLLEAVLRTLAIRRCLLPVPAFNEYRRALARARIEVAPLVLHAETGFRYDVEAMLAGDHDAILLANPQNPSGVACDLAVVLELAAAAAERGMYVLLDEAFIDYLPERSACRYVERFANLIVFRSVTKFYGIPGLRIAYAVASTEKAAAIDANLPPWPVTSLAAVAVIAALADRDYADRSLRLNQQRREELQAGLLACGLYTYPSGGNFVLMRLPADVRRTHVLGADADRSPHGAAILPRLRGAAPGPPACSRAHLAGEFPPDESCRDGDGRDAAAWRTRIGGLIVSTTTEPQILRLRPG